MEGEPRLVQRARAGDRTAFDALVGPLVEPAYRFAYGMLQDREAAEDAVQEAAFKAWRKLGNVKEGSTIRPWFFGIVANQCRGTRRARWWSVLKVDSLERMTASHEDRIVRDADVRRALRSLPAQQREAVVLFYFLDLPIEEVASITGAPVGTVKSRIHRGRERVRSLVEIPSEVYG